jgi:hypothetical protein
MPRRKKKTADDIEMTLFLEAEAKRAKEKRELEEKKKEENKKTAEEKPESKEERLKRVGDEIGAVYYTRYWTVFAYTVDGAAKSLERLSEELGTPMDRLIKIVRLPLLSIAEQVSVAELLTKPKRARKKTSGKEENI